MPIMNTNTRTVRLLGVVAVFAVVALTMTSCSSGGDSAGKSITETPAITVTKTVPTTVTFSPDAADARPTITAVGSTVTETVVTTVLAQDAGRSGSSTPSTSGSGKGICTGTTGSWSTADETAPFNDEPKPIASVSGAVTNCYDSVTINIQGAATPPGYIVKYVPQVTAQGSGNSVTLAGSAALEVTIDSPMYDPSGQPLMSLTNPMHLVSVSGYQSIQQVAYVDSLEGQTVFGIGVSGHKAFHVTAGGPITAPYVTIKIAH